MSKRFLRLCLVLGCISCLGTLALYPSLPDLVPTNWNWQGVITSWGPKHTVFIFAAIPVLVPLGLMALPRVDPRRQNYQKHQKAYRIVSGAITLMCIGINWALILPAMGINIPTISLWVGIAFVIFGNYMPQLRSNFFMGIRTPWALDNETVWLKTHRVGGVVFCLSGILMVLGAVLPRWPVLTFLPMGVLSLGTILTIVYSFICHKKLKAKAKEEDENAKN